MLKGFNKRFGLKPNLEEEQEKFIVRTNFFFEQFKTKILSNDQYISLFNTICVQFGKNPDDHIFRLGAYTRLDDLTNVAGGGFLNTLKVWTCLRKYFSRDERTTALLDEAIVDLIEKAETNLSIRYNKGQFYPSKEKVLDHELIDSGLNVLNRFPDEDKDFRIALDNYSNGDKYGVVEVCYRCIEGLARKLLNNNKTLIDNKADLLRFISAADQWKKILVNYIEFGNDYGRHASSKRHLLTDKEAEGYLYMTGLLIRLIIK